MQNDPALETWFRAFLAGEGGMAGTVHTLGGDALLLRAAVSLLQAAGLPASTLAPW
jgi:hypothetical protein